MLFEESARLPLIISTPGIPGAGRTCHGLVEFVDVYPTLTLVELFGIERPAGLDSLVPGLRDPAWPGKKAVYTTVGRIRTAHT
jgi:iduronate 2-sulfatase